MNLQEATISSIHAAFQAGSLSCYQLVQSYLNQIAAHDKSDAAINAILSINSEALSAASHLDAVFKTSGLVGALHGIPVLVKDNIDTADLPTTAGSVLLKNSIPPQDAFVIQKLRQAGAIILAKTNLHELARTGTTVSSWGGQTLNPYDLTRTPGGSSGGTGAAIAANMGAVGLGTDTVNSIRSPASACSLVGLRPTMGLVSRSGVIPAALTQDMIGPITRTVADAAIVMEVIAGYDPNDPVTAYSIGQSQPYTQFLDKAGLLNSRLGRLRSFFGSGSEFEEVNQLMDAAIADMARLGTEVVELDAALDVDHLIEAIDVQKWETQSQLNHYLAGLGPTAPVKNLQEWVASGQYHASIAASLQSACEVEFPLEELAYLQRLHRREQLRQTLLGIMADHRLDAIVYPHQKRLVVPVGEPQRDRNGFLASGSGFPAIAVPAGFSQSGVPAGLEFLGRPFSEPTLFKLAYAYEQATQHRRPPMLHG